MSQKYFFVIKKNYFTAFLWFSLKFLPKKSETKALISAISGEFVSPSIGSLTVKKSKLLKRCTETLIIMLGDTNKTISSNFRKYNQVWAFPALNFCPKVQKSLSIFIFILLLTTWNYEMGAFSVRQKGPQWNGLKEIQKKPLANKNRNRKMLRTWWCSFSCQYPRRIIMQNSLLAITVTILKVLGEIFEGQHHSEEFLNNKLWGTERDSKYQS